MESHVVPLRLFSDWYRLTKTTSRPISTYTVPHFLFILDTPLPTTLSPSNDPFLHTPGLPRKLSIAPLKDDLNRK